VTEIHEIPSPHSEVFCSPIFSSVRHSG
jgi:hypothetical protein